MFTNVQILSRATVHVIPLRFFSWLPDIRIINIHAILDNIYTADITQNLRSALLSNLELQYNRQSMLSEGSTWTRWTSNGTPTRDRSQVHTRRWNRIHATCVTACRISGPFYNCYDRRGRTTFQRRLDLNATSRTNLDNSPTGAPFAFFHLRPRYFLFPPFFCSG